MKRMWIMVGFLAACSAEADKPVIVTTGGDMGIGADGSNNVNNTNNLNNANNANNQNNVVGAGELIGSGDGSVESVTFTEILPPQGVYQATDLEFNPQEPTQLWLTQRSPRSDQMCTNADRSGCLALVGYATIIQNPGEANQTSERREDPNSWHFLRRPPAIAFGKPGTFGTCGEWRTGNWMDEPADFMGPSLWSSDLNVFARDPGPGLNGSHLDMLHATPWCVGMAWERENIYWLFNGNVGSIDKYDFKNDHGPGNADHSDGEVFRYAIGELTRVPDVPSGMHFDSETSLLYVVDSGAGRVISLDTTSGERGGAVTPLYEPFADNAVFNNATVETVIEAGTMQTPSGMVVHEDVLYITDHATATIHAFDLEGNELRTLDTPMRMGELSGITLGPDGKLYIASLVDSHVLRIDP